MAVCGAYCVRKKNRGQGRQTMKAIRVAEYGAPEVMKLTEMPELSPSKGELLVRVKAAGVNPIDAYMRSGSFYKAPLPYTPGIDAAGIVEAVGEGVIAFEKGDEVYVSGTVSGAYAETLLCRESSAHCYPVHLSCSQAACIGVPYTTAYRGLFQKARALSGETVLIHGASGGVGIAAVQLSDAFGLTVIGTAGTEKGRGLVLAEGAHYVLDHGTPLHYAEIMDITKGKGVDIIIEFLANANLGMDLKCLARHGRVVVIGCRGGVEIDPRDAMGKDAVIMGMSLFNATEAELTSIHAGIYAGLDNETLCPVVGREMALIEAPAAHHAIMEENAHGKIILLP